MLSFRWAAPATLLMLALPSAPVRAQTLEVLHELRPYSPPAGPRGALLQAADGDFYGTSQTGGLFNHGTIFRITRTGVVTVLHSFNWSTDGADPVAGLVQTADGSLYGVARDGGLNSTSLSGHGTAFRVAADGTFHVVHVFGGKGDVGYPLALVQGSDGDFYGIAERSTDSAGSINVKGAVFKMTAGGNVTVLHAFSGEALDGDTPSGLIQARDGNFYGTTWFGGTGGWGTVFRMTSGGVASILHSFSGGVDDGESPQAGVIEATDGNFYGTTFGGGVSDSGTVFRMTPSGVVTILHSFAGGSNDGWFPATGVIEASDGTFRGTTNGGGAFSKGTAFAMSADGIVTVQHSFECSQPYASLMQANDGTFFGTTSCGGAFGTGTVFTLDGAGAFTVLHEFTRGSEGRYAIAPLVEAPDGTLYGATCYGGTSNAGTAFKLSPSRVFTVLYTFTGGTDGVCPDSLVPGADGAWYGTTTSGGASGFGTAFKLTSGGAFTLLHAFAGGADGASPVSLLVAKDGNFYGATSGGGTANLGTLFRMASDGSVTVLHEFVGGATDGAVPRTILQGREGNFYGTTSRGGSSNGGTAFKMTPTGSMMILHTFSGTSTDGSPETAFVERADGEFSGFSTYSTFLSPHTGTVCHLLFRVFSSGGFEVARDSLACQPLEASILLTLTTGEGGTLYGTDSMLPFGGSAIFGLTSSGERVYLRSLDYTSEGGAIYAPMIRGAGGYLYGVSGYGGLYTGGTIFRFRVAPDPPKIVAIRKSNGMVRLDWSAVQGATSYTIKRGDRPGAETTLADNVTAASYVDGTAARGRRYFYVVTVHNQFADSVASYEVSVTLGRATTADFDGDGKTDVTVYRPALGNWYIQRSSNLSPMIVPWGATGDVPVGEDYDGDGVIDVAVFRPSTGTWYLRQSSTLTLAAVPFGAIGDIPVPGDYDGDGKADVAVFRPSVHQWFIRQSSTLTTTVVDWGDPGDAAVPGDYDGDGNTDVAIFRPSTHQWFVRQSSMLVTMVVGWGESGDVAVPGDYDGDGRTDLAVFRPSDGSWRIRKSGSTATWVIFWGGTTDIPVVGDFDGDGISDIAVFRPSSGTWYIRPQDGLDPSAISWGNPADIPAPGDYDGDGKTDVAIDRGALWYIRQSRTGAAFIPNLLFPDSLPAPGDYDGDGRTDPALFVPYFGFDNWAVLLSSTGALTYFTWGGGTDTPVAADYDGDGKTDVAVFRPETGEWFIRRSSNFTTMTAVWGGFSDVPVPGDYDGDGKADIAVFRPATGEWFIRRSSDLTAATISWGGVGDMPVPKDFDGDHVTDVAVFRPSTGAWYIRQSASLAMSTGKWGTAGDVPAPGDYDGDGKADVAVFRPSTGGWYIHHSGTLGDGSISWGAASDIPIPQHP